MIKKNSVKGYKVFKPDWTCSPNGNKKQYTCPGKFEEDTKVEICEQGMHFCKNLADCFNYYTFDPNNKVAEVIAYGEVFEQNDKSCTNKLEIVREVPWDELLRIVNTGKDCTGLCNTGDWNTGNWNKSSFTTGCFNTAEQKILMFNKPSDWTYDDWLRSDARYLMNQIPKDVVEWIYASDMTEEEKAEYPTYKTTGGYLKVLDESECGQIWWDGLPKSKRGIIRALPNFDSTIFEEITGIKVE